MAKKNEKDLLEEYEGQLAVDVIETNDTVILRAPVAGVTNDDLEIAITDEVINIKGERHEVRDESTEKYFAQECYWGKFSRSFILPVTVQAEKAEAQLKNGILTIKIPKLAKTKTKMVEVKEVE